MITRQGLSDLHGNGVLTFSTTAREMGEYVTDVLEVFPDPLLDDLVRGKWLPVIGAGFSKNAVTPPGKKMPLWDEVGHQLGDEIKGYPYHSPLDAISAYEHEYSRARLIEKLTELLLVNEARPGSAHKAFCSIPFDIVCTTNLEFLLEKQYDSIQRYCRPVIEEDQLTANVDQSAVTLVKLHGDLHHPKRMVITEEDYDSFLDNYPLLATYLTGQLVTRTAVFIGYSLTDPDFRQIWQLIGDRLGKARREAYALLFDPATHEIAKYRRRGVDVVALPNREKSYGEVLTQTFEKLADYWTTNVISAGQVVEEDPLRELVLPSDSPSRLCFFAIPYELHSFYREEVFPVARSFGLVPTTAADVITPGSNMVAKVEALISRAYAVVVDVSSPFSLHELGVARGKQKSRRTLVVLSEEQPETLELKGLTRIRRPSDPYSVADDFVAKVEEWFERIGERAAGSLEDEPRRLFNKGEFRAAVVSAITLLETRLRQALRTGRDVKVPSHASFGQLLGKEMLSELIGVGATERLHEWRVIRNRAVHTDEPVNRELADEIVSGVDEIVRELEVEI